VLNAVHPQDDHLRSVCSLGAPVRLGARSRGRCFFPCGPVPAYELDDSEAICTVSTPIDELAFVVCRDGRAFQSVDGELSEVPTNSLVPESERSRSCDCRESAHRRLPSFFDLSISCACGSLVHSLHSLRPRRTPAHNARLPNSCTGVKVQFTFFCFSLRACLLSVYQSSTVELNTYRLNTLDR
jgi:hypothetical protein